MQKEKRACNEFQKASYYCPYCGHANLIAFRFNSVLCNYCHYKYEKKDAKNVYEENLKKRLITEHKKYLERRNVNA